MPSECELFWERQTYAVVGDSAKRKFPRLTYNGLKQRGKTVYAVDPSASEVEGDTVYTDLVSLPTRPDAVVMEVSPEQTEAWVRKAAEAGVKEVWLHQQTDTPEALAAADELGMHAVTGHCAVMYQGKHALHRWVWKLLKKY